MDANTTFLVNMALAALLGTAIGLERQWRPHTAGLKTHALVAFGAALFVALPGLLGGTPTAAQLAGQVVTGVGFLGGGVILREGLNIRGLNTAATMWCSAAVGALIGAGLRLEGLAAAGGVLALNLLLRPVSDWMDRRLRRATNVQTTYRLLITCRTGREGAVREVLLGFAHEHPSLTLQGLATQEGGMPELSCVTADLYAERREDRTMEDLTVLVDNEPGVRSVSWKRNLAA
ncbi:MAG: MgtC/SapB family protein [Planctomycetes bacterium]|nr:MgtC/SapB family protein [Planctomycetota bacterium]